jgi:hypothetical protein
VAAAQAARNHRPGVYLITSSLSCPPVPPRSRGRVTLERQDDALAACSWMGSLPGLHQLTVAAGGGPQLHFWVESGLAGLHDQAEQFSANVWASVGNVAGSTGADRTWGSVQLHQFVRHSSPRRPALQLCGQRQGGLAERHAVESGMGAVPGDGHPGLFGQNPFLFSLDRVPVALNLIGP